MKKTTLIIALLCSIAYTQAQIAAIDSIACDSLQRDTLGLSLQDNDSLTTTEIRPTIDYKAILNDSNLTEIELRSMEWALQWIETSDCVVIHDTTTLSDSIYKTRLQALPCVIELPYNERVRAFLLRYVKRSPKQVARLMLMSEYSFPLFE